MSRRGGRTSANDEASAAADGVPGWQPPAADDTREGHAEVLRRLRNSAAEAGSWAAAVSAELQRGRLLGLNEPDAVLPGHRYLQMPAADRRLWVAEAIRQWDRQGLIPAEVEESIARRVLERGAIRLPQTEAGASSQD